MIWILININRIEIRILVVYMPQESRTTVQELADCYRKMENEIEKANQEEQHIIIVGDLNCRIGNKVNGNDNAMTKGERMPMELVIEHNLHLMNAGENVMGHGQENLGRKNLYYFTLN